jgi:glycosyltransferase involved in cell wall biosynthesis
MPFVLILMIKNEEKILRRCLESVENLVDHFCITDTGSTDNSLVIAEEFLQTHKGKVFNNEWKNFGHNRSLSFLNAKDYLTSIECDLTTIYGLLLDADMVFVQGTLREQKLTSIGYKFIQVNGNLEYYNTRLVRMDYPWKCVGVTHEYWDGPNESLTKDICFIDDHNDGGSKNDKFERDERLLLQGVQDEPTNVRYVFYLAQTYKCLAKWKDAIIMYKKRIAMGGWRDEVWYSMYMIGLCHKSLNNIHKFEYWMNKAHDERPWRAEPIYELAKYFREISKHHKAYYYCLVGSAIKFPVDDVLFVDKPPYTDGFLYEKTILDYYVHTDKRIGVRDTVEYLIKSSNLVENVIRNLSFYATPISNNIKLLNIPYSFGENFRPSGIHVLNYPYANVRYVNYLIPENNHYRTIDGSPIQTQNAYINIETCEVIANMDDSSITLPRIETHVKGLEDIRLFMSGSQLKFLATNIREYDRKIRMITGTYNTQLGTYSDVSVLRSPENRDCEKNWLPIPHKDCVIYDWNPLTIMKLDGNMIAKHSVPPIFSLFRGSAPPIEVNNKWIAMVHIVDYNTTRKYYHLFVELDKEIYRPTRISTPFIFKSATIEYCTSIYLANDTTILCYPSIMDSNPYQATIDLTSIEWINV